MSKKNKKAAGQTLMAVLDGNLDGNKGWKEKGEKERRCSLHDE